MWLTPRSLSGIQRVHFERVVLGARLVRLFHLAVAKRQASCSKSAQHPLTGGASLVNGNDTLPRKKEKKLRFQHGFTAVDLSISVSNVSRASPTKGGFFAILPPSPPPLLCLDVVLPHAILTPAPHLHNGAILPFGMPVLNYVHSLKFPYKLANRAARGSHPEFDALVL